jgi:hypothetical protein
MGGRQVLRNASCIHCAQHINATIENPMARGPFWSARKYLGLPSRRRHKDPLPVTLFEESTGKEITVKISDADNPAMLTLVGWAAQPRIFENDTVTLHPGPHFASVCSHIFDSNRRQAFDRKHVGYHLISPLVIVPTLARLLAKICHGLAVMEYGHHAFEPLLRNFIIDGTHNEATHFVGEVNANEKNTALHLWRSFWEPIRDTHHLIYEIQLFGFAEMPTYEVVVGKTPRWKSAAEADILWKSLPIRNYKMEPDPSPRILNIVHGSMHKATRVAKSN